MTVDDGGEIRVFDIAEIASGKAQFYLHNDVVPTWGCAVSSATSMVAVSANSFNITLFDLSVPSPQNDKKLLEGHKHNIPCLGI